MSKTVWEDPAVVEILAKISEKVDVSILCTPCAGKNLITRLQSIALQSMTNPIERMGHLLSMLSAGSGQSFQTFVNILDKQLPFGQKDLYEKLKAAGSQHTGISTFDQSIHCLASVKKSELDTEQHDSSATTTGLSATTTGEMVDINRSTLKILDTRFAFVQMNSGFVDASDKTQSPAPPPNSGMAGKSGLTSATGNVEQPLASGSNSAPPPNSGMAGNSGLKSTTSNVEQPLVSGSDSTQKAITSTTSTDSGNAQAWSKRTWKPGRFEYRSMEQQGKDYMRKRLGSRIVILTGNMDALLDDLTRREIATPANIVELTTVRESGIYCLTPSNTWLANEPAPPIYLILCLLSNNQRQTHEHLVRLALRMSLHVVVYYGQESLLSGQAFSPTLQGSRPESDDTHDITGLIFKRLQKVDYFQADEIDFLYLLQHVVKKFPVNGHMGSYHQPVRLHCVLNIAKYVESSPRQQCFDRVKALFNGFYVSEPSSSEQGNAPGAWVGRSPFPLLHLVSVRVGEEFNLKSVHIRGAERSNEVTWSDSDPFVNPMWLHDLWGLNAAAIMQCEPSTDETNPQTDDEFDGQQDHQHQHQKHRQNIDTPRPFKGTRIISARESKEVEGENLLISDEIKEVKDEVHLGILERIVDAWKGSVHVTTFLASSDNSVVCKFLSRFAGTPLLVNLKTQKTDALFAMWHFHHGTGVLHIFLLFNFSMQDANERDTAAALVFAATALSNTCLLPSSGQSSWLANVTQLQSVLQKAVRDQLPAYPGRNTEDEILSGYLLVGGRKSTEPPSLSSCKDKAWELTNYFFAGVVFTPKQDFESRAMQLLAYPCRFYQELYKESYRFVMCIQLLARAINMKSVKTLNLGVFLQRRDRKFLWELNRLARYGDPLDCVEVAHILGDEPFSTGRDAISKDVENVMFSLESLVQFADVVSGDHNEFPYDDVDVPQDEETKKITVTHQQEECQQQMGKRAVSNKKQQQLSVTHKPPSNSQAKPSYTNYFQELWESVEDDHISRVNRRRRAVTKWLEICDKENSMRSMPLKTQLQKYGEGLAHSAEGLCNRPCEHECDFHCLLLRGHDGQCDCLINRKPEDPQSKHICQEPCELCECEDRCDFRPGHHIQQESATESDNRHLCAARKERHGCQNICDLFGADGCKGTCSMIQGHGGACRCDTPVDDHLCDQHCEFHEQCGNTCTNKFKKPADHQHHVCSNESHQCTRMCNVGGVCCKSTKPADGFVPYNDSTTDGWTAPCAIPIPKGRWEHTGMTHKCNEGHHKCEKACPLCGRCCDRNKDEYHDVCSTTHGPAETECAKTLGLKLVSKDESITVSDLAKSAKARTCPEVCFEAGPWHRHTSQGKQRRTHSNFWKEFKFKNPNTPEDTAKFDRCLVKCKDCTDSFCQLRTCHPGILADEHKSSPKVAGVFEYVSTPTCSTTPGHLFKCQIEGYHKCPGTCKQPVSVAVFFTNDCGKECAAVAGHDFQQRRYCKCGGVHVCGKTCKGNNKCRNKCQEDADQEHTRHDCGEKTCREKCTVPQCQDCGVLKGGTICKVRTGTCRMKYCDHECSVPDHFHILTDNHPHYCGLHKCWAPCRVVGRCPSPIEQGKRGRCTATRTNACDDSNRHERSCDFSCGGDPLKHLCEGKCEGEGCSGVCKEPLGNPEHRRHSCGKPRCLARCGIRICKNCGSTTNKPRCDVKTTGRCDMDCQTPCSSGDHLHKSSNGSPHNCGNHECKKPCTCEGRCPSGVTGRCNVKVTKLTGESRHDGPCKFTCGGDQSKHLCKESCKGQGCTAKCNTPLGNSAHHRHSCDEKKCKTLCQIKICKHCGSTTTTAKQWCDVKTTERCVMVCWAPCSSGDHLHTSSNDSPHNCGNHECKKQCTCEGRCPSDVTGRCNVKVTKLTGKSRHDGDCRFSCGGDQSDHLCKVECEGAGCNTMCKENLSNAEHQHSCGGPKCRAPCEIKICKYCASTTTEPSNPCTVKTPQQCDLRECQNSCSCDEHLHKSSSDKPHNCNTHKCNKLCTCNGQCPYDITGRCNVTVTKLPGGSPRHDGDCEFTCGGIQDQHTCPGKCEESSWKFWTCDADCSQVPGFHSKHKCKDHASGSGHTQHDEERILTLLYEESVKYGASKSKKKLFPDMSKRLNLIGAAEGQSRVISAKEVQSVVDSLRDKGRTMYESCRRPGAAKGSTEPKDYDIPKAIKEWPAFAKYDDLFFFDPHYGPP